MSTQDIKDVKGIKIQTGEKVSIFPLPNAILFPFVELPLYIFESRYQQMLKDSAEGNNLIAISLLKRGWETEKEPLPCHEVVGIGYIKLAIQNSDGTSHIILKGVSRAKILEYLQWEPYRIAKVTPLETALPASQNITWRSRKLSKLFVEKIFLTKNIQEEEARSLERITDPEELSDLVASTLKVDFFTKQELLETMDLEQRFDRLTHLLESEVSEIKRRN